MTEGHVDERSRPAAPGEPLTLAYRDAPTGEVVASEAALRALAKTRPWAMLCAIGLFVYGVGGVGLGVVWGITLKANAGQPGFPVGQFIVLTSANLLFAPIALVGGFLAVGHHVAAGRALARRSPTDLERAVVAQLRVWRWGAATMLALFAFPAVALSVAALMDVWP